MNELLRPANLELCGQTVSVEWGETIAMLGGIDAGGYEFETARIFDQEAGFYHLLPGRPTRVVKVVGDVICWEKPVQGSCWLLICRRDGTVEKHEFDASPDQPEPGWILYGQGDAIVWGAKDTGARVFSASNKPFTDEMEVHVRINSKELPSEFWYYYHTFVPNSDS